MVSTCLIYLLQHQAVLGVSVMTDDLLPELDEGISQILDSVWRGVVFHVPVVRRPVNNTNAFIIQEQLRDA